MAIGPLRAIDVQIREDNTAAYLRLLDDMAQDMTKTIAEGIAASMRGLMRGHRESGPSGRIYKRYNWTYQASGENEAPAVPPLSWRTSFLSLELNQTFRGNDVKSRAKGTATRKFINLSGLIHDQGIDAGWAALKRQGYLQAEKLRKRPNSSIRKKLAGVQKKGNIKDSLINSIKAQPIVKRDVGRGSSWRIEMDVTGIYLDLGTPTIAPRPFVVPAVEKWRSQAPNLYKQYFSARATGISKGSDRGSNTSNIGDMVDSGE